MSLLFSEMLISLYSYLKATGLCGRTPKQSFIDTTESNVRKICSASGWRLRNVDGSKRNLCMSDSLLQIYDVMSKNNGGCTVQKVKKNRRKVIVACDKVDNQCLPVHFEAYRHQMPSNRHCRP